jgi:phosphoribosyl 1,2-cyclic phosphate phosphodiesterase
MLRIEFLGSGAALPLPLPTCDCRLCEQARGRGVPYSRNGPSIFVHGPDLLIDTPEDIIPGLNRASIKRVSAVTWSHWHPDHTAGNRLFESLNLNLGWPPAFGCTPVYLPEGVNEDFDRYMGLGEQLSFHERRGIITRHIVPDGGSFTLGGVTVEPYRLPDPGVNACAFILTEGHKRVLIAPDELFSWEPDDSLGHFDLAVLAAGLFEFHPLTGERVIAAEHPILQRKATFRQTLDIARRLDADRTIFTHILAHPIVSYDDLMGVQRRLASEQPDLGSIMFAFDRLSVMP